MAQEEKMQGRRKDGDAGWAPRRIAFQEGVIAAIFSLVAIFFISADGDSLSSLVGHAGYVLVRSIGF